MSGAQTIIFKGSRYLVEQPVVGLEGGIVENLGKPLTRIEIHGGVWESGADRFLAVLSGLIGKSNEIYVPSFNSGYYFIPDAGVRFENLKFIYDAGHGSPIITTSSPVSSAGRFISGRLTRRLSPTDQHMHLTRWSNCR